MKKIIIIGCILFTIITLCTSFSPYINKGNIYSGCNTHYQLDEVSIGSKKYIVGTTSSGSIAICPE